MIDRLATPRRWIVLPIETKAREFDAKALFAFAAAERGWGTILGTMTQAHTPSLPRGIFLDNGISNGRAEKYRAIRARGSQIVSWCEEGLIYQDAAEYGRRKIEPAAYDLLDRFFAWGPSHARDMVDALGHDGRKLVVAGNPRFDVLRPELRAIFADRVDALRQQYGRFILINTKLNRYNHYFGHDFFVKRMQGTGQLPTPEAEALAKGDVAFQCEMMQEFVTAARRLSETFAEETIVLRPHPSEDHAPWKALAADLGNVHVVFEGNVVAWILAAAATIHNNCTTGVEAYLVDKPSIAYRPIRDARYDMRLPHALSVEADDLRTLCTLVRRCLEGEPLLDADEAAARKTVAREYIAGIDERTACDTIMRALDAMPVEPEPLPADAIARADANADAGADAAARRLPAIAQPWDESRTSRYQSYLHQKCDGLSAPELLACLASARRATGRFADVDVAALRQDLLCVY